MSESQNLNLNFQNIGNKKLEMSESKIISCKMTPYCSTSEESQMYKILLDETKERELNSTKEDCLYFENVSLALTELVKIKEEEAFDEEKMMEYHLKSLKSKKRKVKAYQRDTIK